MLKSSLHNQPESSGGEWQRLEVLITIKTSPTPSKKYGETVCVAGLRVDDADNGWVRLYPINFRERPDESLFKKYEVVTLLARANSADHRFESWTPNVATIQRSEQVLSQTQRRTQLDSRIEDSMCAINREVRNGQRPISLALVRPREVIDLELARRKGWSLRQRQTLTANRVKAALDPKTYRPPPLQLPRFDGWYHYRCHDPQCRVHRQKILDWEFTAAQFHKRNMSDADLTQALRHEFLTDMCGPARDTAFFVGNQRQHPGSFSMLGVYRPWRSNQPRQPNR